MLSERLNKMLIKTPYNFLDDNERDQIMAKINGVLSKSSMSPIDYELTPGNSTDLLIYLRQLSEQAKASNFTDNEHSVSIISDLDRIMANDMHLYDMQKIEEIGNKICKILNVKSFPYSCAYQTTDTFDAKVGDFDTLIESFKKMNSEYHLGANLDNIDEAAKLMQDFINHLPKSSLCTETDGNGKLSRTFYKCYGNNSANLNSSNGFFESHSQYPSDFRMTPEKRKSVLKMVSKKWFKK